MERDFILPPASLSIADDAMAAASAEIKRTNSNT